MRSALNCIDNKHSIHQLRMKKNNLHVCVLATIVLVKSVAGIELASFDLYVNRHNSHVSLATAPAPAPGSLNITLLLEKAGQFTTFMTLLESTQVGLQLQIQANSSQQGITIFAPSDSAFAALRPGALNTITDQEKMALLQYHVLPSYYSFSQFQTLSNPLRTLASGNGGNFYLNVTAYGSQVNMSTGLVNTPISNAVFSQSPVAVYEVDKVLLPEDLFGVKPASVPVSGSPAPLSAIAPSGGNGAGSTPTSGSIHINAGLSPLTRGLFLILLLLIWL